MSVMTRIERIPNWPQMMTRKLAADYCCLSEAEFEREILDGRLPQPVKLGSRDHWHKPDLDQHLERTVVMHIEPGDFTPEALKAFAHPAPTGAA